MKYLHFALWGGVAFWLGCLYSLSFVPNSSWLASFIAVGLVFAIIVWHGILVRNLVRLSLLIFSFSTGKWLVGMGWVFNSLTKFGNFPPLLGVTATLLAAVLMGCFLFITTILYVQIMTRYNLYRANHTAATTHSQYPIFFAATLFALMWLLMEVIRDNFSFFNVAWLNLGYAIIDVEIFAPMLSIVGVYGVSFWLAWTAAIIIGLMMKMRQVAVNGADKKLRRLSFDWLYFAIWLGVTVIFLLYWQLNSDQLQQHTDHTIQISAKQTNVDPISKWSLAGNKLLWSQLLENTNRQADLLIWPEGIISGALSLSSLTDEQSQPNITPILQTLSVPVLFGSITTDERNYFNSALLYDKDEYQYYHKQKLVAFGEFTPNFLAPIADLLNIPFSSLQSSNMQPEPMQLKTLHKTWAIATIICYESNFVDYVRKIASQSNFLVVITESQWFTPSYQPWQHLQMIRARAIENGIWTVFVNNGGPSAVIHPNGQIVKQSQSLIADTIDFTIPDASKRTIYGTYGNTVLYIILLILSIVFIINNKAYQLSSTKR